MDCEHRNDKPEARVSGPVPAAGWVKELKADETGLWGRVAWKATAREMNGRKEYRYLSPSFLHNKAGQIMRLKGAGLVHNPDLYFSALASQEDTMDQPKSEAATLAEFAAALVAALGLPPETPGAALLAKLKARLTAEPDPVKYMPVAAVQSMLDARGQERAALAEAQVVEKVDRACREGYLTPAMKPWTPALCRSDAGALDAFMEKAGPVYAHLLKPSHTSALPPDDNYRTAGPESDLERAICEQLGLKPGSLMD